MQLLYTPAMLPTTVCLQQSEGGEWDFEFFFFFFLQLMGLTAGVYQIHGVMHVRVAKERERKNKRFR